MDPVCKERLMDGNMKLKVYKSLHIHKVTGPYERVFVCPRLILLSWSSRLIAPRLILAAGIVKELGSSNFAAAFRS